MTDTVKTYTFEKDGIPYANVSEEFLKERGFNDQQIADIAFSCEKETALIEIKQKAIGVRSLLTAKADPIYLLGLANKADIGRAIINNTATTEDTATITAELAQRKALGLSPKSYTVLKLANEQVKRQNKLVSLANFVEYFEKNAISQIKAQTTVETVKSTLQQLNTDANTALEKLMTTA